MDDRVLGRGAYSTQKGEYGDLAPPGTILNPFGQDRIIAYAERRRPQTEDDIKKRLSHEADQAETRRLVQQLRDMILYLQNRH